jgi:hypothetical protein
MGDMTVTAIVVGAVVLFLGGGVTGWSLAAKQSAALEVQGEQFAALQAGQASIVDAAARPVVLDAELRATLAGTPPACVKVLGGDPLTPHCMLQTCWQYGQSSAQRPECRAVEAAVVEQLGCPAEGE